MIDVVQLHTETTTGCDPMLWLQLVRCLQSSAVRDGAPIQSHHADADDPHDPHGDDECPRYPQMRPMITEDLFLFYLE